MTSHPISSIRDLAGTVRGRRRALGLSQAELGERARVSRQWISEFEAGKPAAEMQLVLRLLDALDLRLSVDDGRLIGGDQSSGAIDLDALIEEHRAP